MALWVRTWGREAAGWSLLGLGILFFPLPLVPGLLLVAGLLILSARHEWANSLLRKVKAQFPSMFKKEAEPVPAKAA